MSMGFLRRTAAALVASALVAGCAGASSPLPSSPPATSGPTGSVSQPPAGDATLVWAKAIAVDSAFAVETNDAWILTTAGVAETLARTNFDGQLEPALATEWKRTGDLTWEFAIREGVKFHDGTALDANAVVGALTHVLEVDPPARSFNPSTVAGVEAVGNLVVEITTVTENVLLPVYLASPNTIILAPKAYAGQTIDPIEAGTGPFVLTESNVPESITLERNDDYWGGEVALAGAEIRFVPDGGTRATLVQTGEVHLADSVPIAVVPTLDADSNVEVVRGALARTNSMYLNNEKAPLDDVRVRQAIQAAVDVDALSNAVLEGAVAPGIGPFSPNAAFAPSGAAPISRDLDRARQLLSDAGIAEGSLTLSLWAYPSRPELPDVAVAIQAMLSEVGIATEVRVADYAALEPDVLAGNFDMMLLSRGYLTDINDPIGYLRADYTCEGSYNLSHFCDPEVDTALAEALTNENVDERYALYADLAARLQEDAVDVFLYHPQEISAIRNTVSNYRIHPLQHFVLTPQMTVSE